MNPILNTCNTGHTDLRKTGPCWMDVFHPRDQELQQDILQDQYLKLHLASLS